MLAAAARGPARRKRRDRPVGLPYHGDRAADGEQHERHGSDQHFCPRLHRKLRTLSSKSLAGVCAYRAGSIVLRLQILFGRRLVLHFFPMMLNDASCGRSYYGVMAGHVTHHAADCRAFQAALGARNP